MTICLYDLYAIYLYAYLYKTDYNFTYAYIHTMVYRYVPDGLTRYYGKWAAGELSQIVSINRNFLNEHSYAYWRDKNTLRVVPGGYIYFIKAIYVLV